MDAISYNTDYTEKVTVFYPHLVTRVSMQFPPEIK